MNDITCVEIFSRIGDPEAVVELIKKQMGVIGGQADGMRIRRALETALQPGKRARLFLRIREGGTYDAFAFGNVCSGLESGGDYLWLNELYVDEPYRRQGIAALLLAFIERWCAGQGIRYMACITGKTNSAAQGFYTRIGFSLDEVVWVDKSL